MCRILRPDSLPKEKRNYCKTLHLPNFCYLFAGVILHKLCGTLSVVVQCIAEKRGIDLSFFKKKNKQRHTRPQKAFESVVRRKENSFIF